MREIRSFVRSVPGTVNAPGTRGVGETQVGTQEWCRTLPLMEGKVGVFWGGVRGDGKGWPDMKVWKVGVWWKGLEVTFGEGEWFDGEKKGK